MCPDRRRIVIAMSVLVCALDPSPCVAQSSGAAATHVGGQGSRESLALPTSPVSLREPRLWLEASAENRGLGVGVGIRPLTWAWARARIGGIAGTRLLLALDAGPAVTAVRRTAQVRAGVAVGWLRCAEVAFEPRCGDKAKRGAFSPTAGVALRAGDDSDWWIILEGGYWFPFADDALARSLRGVEFAGRVRRFF